MTVERLMLWLALIALALLCYALFSWAVASTVS